MGVFYDSVCLPGDRGRAVLAAIERWLKHRGFQRHDGPALFDLDPVWDRGVYVRTNGRWTVVCYSEHEEAARLFHELGTLDGPLLSLWLWDSEVWGWDLFERGRFAGSYSSDPSLYNSFAGIMVGESNRPTGDATVLGEQLDLSPETVTAISRLERQHGDNEQNLGELCRLLDLEGALAGYGELEHGTVGEPSGWTTEHVLFVHHEAVAPHDVDLYNARITRWSPGPGGTIEAVSGTIEIPPSVLRDLERTRRRRWLMLRLLRPVAILAKHGRQARRWLEGLFTFNRRRAPVTAGFRIDGRTLLNERHGCRLELPATAEPVVVSARPASVFAFRLHGLEVTCTARRLGKLDEILRRPAGSRVVRDERGQTVNGLRTRHVVIQLADRAASDHLVLDVIQTRRAFYVFVCRVRGEIAEGTLEALRGAVQSFRVD